MCALTSAEELFSCHRNNRLKTDRPRAGVPVPYETIGTQAFCLLIVIRYTFVRSTIFTQERILLFVIDETRAVWFCREGCKIYTNFMNPNIEIKILRKKKKERNPSLFASRE